MPGVALEEFYTKAKRRRGAPGGGAPGGGGAGGGGAPGGGAGGGGAPSGGGGGASSSSSSHSRNKRARSSAAAAHDPPPPPPPYIHLHDASVPCSVPPVVATDLAGRSSFDWKSKEYAKMVAERHENCDVLRYLGRIDIQVRTTSKTTISSLVGEVVPPYRRVLAHPRGRMPRIVETWHTETGETCTNQKSLVSIPLLHQAIESFKINVAEEAAKTVDALDALMLPATSPWHMPLVRVLGNLPDDPLAVEDTLHLQVYASRLLFELVADDAVRTVLAALDDEHIATPLTEPNAGAGAEVYTAGVDDASGNSSSSSIDPDSLLSSAIMTKSYGGNTSSSTSSSLLSVSLLPYQQHAVAWMEQQEAATGLGLNALFWETRRFPHTDDVYYAMPASGDLRLSPVPACRGGMLCEEMGMGKTVEVLALATNDIQRNTNVKPTLIVAPPTLLFQWKSEAEKCAPSLRLVMHHVDGGTADRATSTASAKALRNAQIVLTTYRTIETEGRVRVTQQKGGKRKPDNLLKHVEWRRVVLDECQEVRSSTTQLARNCQELESDFRWMVSGTPLHTGLDDLNGELAFLQVYPFCLLDATDGFWKLRVKDPIACGNPQARKLVVDLLRAVLCRHVKSQRLLTDGSSILSLNESSLVHSPVLFNQVEDASHRFVASFLNHHASSEAALARDAAATSVTTSSTATAANKLASGLLRLVKQSVTSPRLVQHAEAEKLLRRTLRPKHRHGTATTDATNSRLQAMDARSAMVHLLQPREAAGAGRFAAEGFVSFQGTASAWRGASRTYGSVPVEQRLETALREALAALSKAIGSIPPEKKTNGSDDSDAVNLQRTAHASIVAQRKALDEIGGHRERSETPARMPRDFAGSKDQKRAERDRLEADRIVSQPAMKLERKRMLLNVNAAMPSTIEAAIEAANAIAESARREANAEASKRKGKGSAIASSKTVRQKEADAALSIAATLAATSDAKLSYCNLLADVLAGLGDQISDGSNLAIEAVTQSGFEALHALAKGEEQQCSICLRNMKDPCVTPCVHMSCTSCFLKWFDAEQGATARCVLCRQPVSLGEVVRIIPQKETDHVMAAAAAGAAASTSQVAAAAPEASWQGVRATLDEEPLDIAKFPPLMHMCARFPALSNDGGTYLAHHASATTSRDVSDDPKFRAMLREVSDAGDEDAKVVIFSQSKETLQLAQLALFEKSVTQAIVMSGMAATARQESVVSFVDGDARVLLLQAGVAAAGLTLTVASKIIFLEPFEVEGDVKQALGRVHRIGQTKAVRASVLYVKGSVEERLLAQANTQAFATLPVAERVARLLGAT